MKKITIQLVVIIGMLISVQSTAAITCTADENKVSYFVGLDNHADDVLAIEGFAPGGEGDATTLLNNFITQDYAAGTTTTESVDVDLTTGTITTSPAIGATELLASSDLAKGNVDISFCAPGTLAPKGILSHAVYFDTNNAFVGVHSTVASLENGVAQAVINMSSSENVGRGFNIADAEGIKGDDRMVRMIEEDGGNNYDASEKKALAQRIFTTALNFTLEQTNKDNIQFNNPTNAFVEGNTFYVEDSSASAQTTNASSGVTTISGSNVLSNNKLSSLENKIGQTYVQKTVQGNKPIHILEARGDLTGASSYTCDDGSNVTISADFAKNSFLEGIINVYDGNTLLHTSTNNTLNYTMPCDNASLTLEGYRTSTRGVALKKKTMSVDVSKNAQQVTHIIGLDGDGDGIVDFPDADGDGNIDLPIDIDCNAPFNYVFGLITDRPSNNYNGGTLPQGMSLNEGTGQINYNAPCSDAGQTFSVGFNADNGPTLAMQFRVQ